MSERDIDTLLRAAVERSHNTIDPDPGAVLSTMSPRLARARLVHRIQVGTGLCATLLVVGLGIMSMRPEGTNNNGFASPGPTDDTAIDDTATDDTAIDDTVEDNIEPDVGQATAQEATATAEATATPKPTDDDDPTPSATSSSSGTSSDTLTESTDAGNITVTYTSAGMNIDPTLALESGWEHTYKKRTPELIELKLTKGDESIEVKIEFKDGKPKFDIEDDGDEPDSD
jgi:hypothetical protein